MTDTTNQTPDQPMTTPQAPLILHAQYIKDVSFENPNAPETYRAGQSNPKTDLSINVDANRLEDENIQHLFEVTLKINAKAVRDEKVVFLAEILYGVTVSIHNIPESQHHAMLLVEVPRLAFPYARKILADLTQEGGYPPLLLGPVDFTAMYLNKFGKKETDVTQ
jgi:preprotein translocase subunit SecB